MLEIDDPLTEQLYAVLVGKPCGSAFGAVKRLHAILDEYYGYGSTILPPQISVNIPTTGDEVSHAMSLAKDSLDRVVELRNA
jgi:hypothetical protein